MRNEALLEEVKSLDTLRAVLRWAFGRTPRAELVTVVAQDEYTHDILYRVSPDVFLVFDTT